MSRRFDTTVVDVIFCPRRVDVGRTPPPSPLTMSVDSDVKVVVDALRESETYVNAVGIFSGKAHKAPGLKEKRTMLLNIVTRPLEEYFLIGLSQHKEFKAIKAECMRGGIPSVLVPDWVSSCVDHRLTFLRRPGTQAG